MVSVKYGLIPVKTIDIIWMQNPHNFLQLSQSREQLLGCSVQGWELDSMMLPAQDGSDY